MIESLSFGNLGTSTMAQVALDWATMTPTTTKRVIVDPACHSKARKVSPAERRMERGGVMLDRVAVVPHFAMPPKSQKCQCGRCGLVFNSLTPFDDHQTMNDDGTVQCWDPASIGLVNRDGIWGGAGSKPIPAKADADGS